MKLKQVAFLFSVLLILNPAFSQKKSTALQARVDSLMMPLVQTNNYSGTVLISKDGKILFSKAYGPMSREYKLANTPDTKFFLASVSMPFTAVAIHKLQEAGKLSIKDPVSKFLPDYVYGSKLTVHDLLAQRSGIPAIGVNGKVDYDSLTKFDHSIEQLYTYFKNEELLFTPGTQYNHGRSDYILLAAIIEKVTGKGFGEYLKEAIFSPLGMQNTGHSSSEKEIIPNVAKGYAPTGLYEVESAYSISWSSKTGHASIYSTTTDLQKFTQAALDGKLLSPASWNALFTNYGDNVGYGWFVSKHLNRDRFQMNGRAPGYSAYAALYPKEKLSVIVLSNNYISLPADVGKSMAAIVFNEPFERLNLTTKPVPADYGQKLAGTYKFDKNFYRPDYELHLTYENGQLTSEWGGLIPIDKGDKHFKEFILRTYWSSITFVADERGQITKMLYDTHQGIKVK
ncbi:hypothetical protein TH61_17485 [Rufibacter sp. DG15C]|uniref:serine hydrolase domain-containing protein n=1 Tax=Rufibacter sp. DG15C TaxID=1379909 RepID=UPI00078BEC3B|nr:serine hydrolase domain-containing protein [Rufibacter sp. DG15C]AMM52616.1 hypothetical protein TH61_17485 [Rufibacter sp. DG15C]